MTQLARKLRVIDYFTLGWGTMVGVGWLVIMDDWLMRGGALGALLGFVIGGALLLPIGWVYGRLVIAMPDAAGEIAYMPIGPGDPKDPVNRRRGALEESAAAAGIVREAKHLGMRGPLSAEAVFSAARRGNRTARRVVEIEAQRLALAIATITPVLDPELVVRASTGPSATTRAGRA